MANSNDIIVTDAIGDELTRNHGYQQAIFGRSYLTVDQTIARNPHFSGETDSILWFSGTTSLCVFNLQDLSVREIKNFFPTYGPKKESLAIRGVLKDSGKTILVFFLVENQPCLAFFGDGNHEPDIYFVDDVLPSCKLT
jgi:hypothetical protein